jgi:HD-GYP domain-containing protein (c-di-GMP phosphodiesterase class II)
MVAFILKSNEPTVLPEGSFERLAEIAGHLYSDPNGEKLPYLTDAEIEALKVPRGSLTVAERVEIERHVVHTYNFLATIPWGRRLRNIPAIAGAHHEKLDGTGYPHGKKAAEIPVESKMMAIADIFDALTASDRPYKRAVPVEKALDIIADEVKRGKCDQDLFRLFIDARVWARVIPG